MILVLLPTKREGIFEGRNNFTFIETSYFKKLTKFGITSSDGLLTGLLVHCMTDFYL